jgi:hypothetical protein
MKPVESKFGIGSTYKDAITIRNPTTLYAPFEPQHLPPSDSVSAPAPPAALDPCTPVSFRSDTKDYNVPNLSFKLRRAFFASLLFRLDLLAGDP